MLKQLQEEYKEFKASLEKDLKEINTYLKNSNLDYFSNEYDEIEEQEHIKYNIAVRQVKQNKIELQLLEEAEKQIIREDLKELFVKAKKNIVIRNKVINLIMQL